MEGVHQRCQECWEREEETKVLTIVEGLSPPKSLPQGWKKQCTPFKAIHRDLMKAPDIGLVCFAFVLVASHIHTAGEWLFLLTNRTAEAFMQLTEHWLLDFIRL